MKLLIINHHYYRTIFSGRGIYPTTPTHLRATVNELQSVGWEIGVQHDIFALLEAVYSGNGAEKLNGPDKVILTFDDGLREQLKAVEALHQLGVAALCFVPTAPLFERKVLDVHKLHMVREQINDVVLAEQLDKMFGFSKTIFDDDLLSIQYRYDAPLSRRVKYFLNFILTVEQRDFWLSTIFKDVFGDERAVADQLYMGIDDLRPLARAGLLGSHGHHHLPLATLTDNEMMDELARSRDLLLQATGLAPLGISYPYGGQSACSLALYAAARKIGYRYGLTMMRGFNQLGSSSGYHVASPQIEPLALNRIDTNDRAQWINQSMKCVETTTQL